MPVLPVIRSRPACKNLSQVGNDLDKLKLHEHHETGQYSKINKRIHILKRRILNQSLFIPYQMIQKARNLSKQFEEISQ